MSRLLENLYNARRQKLCARDEKEAVAVMFSGMAMLCVCFWLCEGLSVSLCRSECVCVSVCVLDCLSKCLSLCVRLCVCVERGLDRGSRRYDVDE